MSIGIFVDRLNQPTMEEIMVGIGPGMAVWDNLVEIVCTQYKVKTDYVYYGKNYGWSLRLRKGGKALVSLYPNQGSFTAQVVLAEGAVQLALGEKMGENTFKAIQAANLYSEGRWLFIKIESEQDAADVRRLLELKTSARNITE